jgi:hypothetical protein
LYTSQAYICKFYDLELAGAQKKQIGEGESRGAEQQRQRRREEGKRGVREEGRVDTKHNSSVAVHLLLSGGMT